VQSSETLLRQLSTGVDFLIEKGKEHALEKRDLGKLLRKEKEGSDVFLSNQREE